MDNINLEKSLFKNRLVLKSELLEIFDISVFLFAGLAYTYMISLVIYHQGIIKNELKPGEMVIYCSLFPFIILLTIQKFRDKRLIELETNLSKKENRNIILNHAKEMGWEIVYNNSDYLRASTPFTWTYGKDITIIYKSGSILINVLQRNPFVRMPTFHSDKRLKKELEKKLKPAHNNGEHS